VKIGESLRTFVDRMAPRDERSSAPSAVSFGQALQDEAIKVRQDVCDRYLAEIEAIGKQIANRCQLSDLYKYKNAIREFLSEVVRHGFGMKDQHSMDKGGRTRLYRIVVELDKALTELAAQLVNTEKDHLAILHQIGEIRGLLLNLYY